MRLPLLAGLSLALLVPPASATAASLTISPKHARFAPSYQYQQIRHEYRVVNEGDKPVVLDRIEARSAGNGRAVDFPRRLEPGQTGTITIEQPTEDFLGNSGFRFALFTDEADVDRYRFSLSGFIQSAYEPERPGIDFGELRRGSAVTRTLKLESREAADWRLVEVIEAPDFLKIALDGHSITATLAEDAPPGFVTGSVLVKTSVPTQDRLAIGLRGYVSGSLVPEQRALGLGAVEIGGEAQGTLRIVHRDGKPLPQRLKVSAPAPWKARIAPCKPAGRSCAVLEVRGPITAPGPFGDVAQLTISGDDEPTLPIRFFGVGLRKGQSVRQFAAEEQAEQAIPAPSLDHALAQITRPDAPANATPPPSAPTSPATVSAETRTVSSGSGPARIHWEADNELRTAGYVVYRASDRAGPYVRASDLIEAHRGADAGRRYEFVDERVKAGQTYYYYIDAVSNKGIKTRLSPVLRKTIASG
ncbi:MAG TPA: hypothetical protein VMR06_16325 [Dokdonella sp.]|uniref:hypothetical protein n=1 Tax=Dokdonella sp. TaxID=2291710 RepID=UPI002BE7D41E|nr:hypothetical protein [Dokdonella sp.]HUD43556.1 hypothetical protein [Dokdonella sp.]